MTTRWMKNHPEFQREGPIRTSRERMKLQHRAQLWLREAHKRKPIIPRPECLRIWREIIDSI